MRAPAAELGEGDAAVGVPVEMGGHGLGEAGVGGAQAPIANAVHNALAPLGGVVRGMPLTPRNVLHAIAYAGEENQR